MPYGDLGRGGTGACGCALAWRNSFGRPAAALPAPLWARSCAGLLATPMKFVVGIVRAPLRGAVHASASMELAAQEQDERREDRERDDESLHGASPGTRRIP